MHVRSSKSRLGAMVLLVLPMLLLGAGASFGQIETLGTDPFDFGDGEDEGQFLVWGLYGFGTLGSHDHEDLNQAIEIMNDEIAAQGTFGVQYDRFESGSSVGGGIRGIFKDKYHLFLEYERMVRSQNVGGITSESDIRMPADVWRASLGYDLVTRGTFRLGVAGGLGYYESAAEQVITETLANQDPVELGRIQMSGSTLGQHYELFLEAAFTEKMYITVSGGYRAAKIDDLEISGLGDLQEPRSDTAFVTVPVAECTNCPETEEEDPPATEEVALRGGGGSLDWSGLSGRVMLTYYVNLSLY